MSNFLTLCQKFQEKTGITGSAIASVVNQTGMNSRIVGWIADAAEDVESLWQDWGFLEGKATITLTSGTDEYSLSAMGITDYISWDKERFYINPGAATYRKLSIFPYEEWLDSRERLGVKTNDEPNKVTIKPDHSLVFMNVPDNTYTVWGRYFITPTRMTVNASTSLIPTTYELIIIRQAQMYYADYYEDPELYNFAEKKYLDLLTRLEAAELPGGHITRTRAANNPEDNMIIPE
jgi:hypothetical protein